MQPERMNTTVLAVLANESGLQLEFWSDGDELLAQH